MSGDLFCSVHGWNPCRCKLGHVEQMNEAIRDGRWRVRSVEDVAREMGMGEVEYAKRPSGDHSGP